MEEIRQDRIARLVLGRLLIALGLMAVVSVGASMVRMPGRSAAAEVSTAPMTAGERAAAVNAGIASMVRVSSVECGTVVTGSGFAVIDDLFEGARLVTNSHLIGDGTAVTVERVDETGGTLRTSATVTADAPQWDLALGPADGVPALPLDVIWPGAGEPVLLLGYGGGRELSVIDATVQSVVNGGAYGVDGTVVLIDRVTAVGYSGGPVIDREGNVVAVLRAYDAATGLSIAVPAANIVELANSTANDSEDRACK